VARAAGVASRRAEPGDRADDRARGEAQAEPLEDAGPEAVDDDVGAADERLGAREAVLRLQVADERLLARVERALPRRRVRAEQVALRRLDPDDARAQPEQLARRERPRRVAGEVDDEQARERLYGRRLYN
jgi:hypothetical protein